MPMDSLTIKLEGTDRDGNAVLLRDFSRFIDTLAGCLRRVEERTTGGVKLRHLITDLGVGSATMATRPVSPRDRPELGRDVYGTFERTIHALETGGRIDPRFRNDDLKAFRELASPIWKGRKRVEVAGVELTTRFISNIDILLRVESRSMGTVKGRIEKLNVHNKHEFTLYPPIGDYAIQCIFADELYDTVHKSVKQTITVSGMLYFRADSPYPDRIQVDSIEIHAGDEELPSLRSLRGSMPDATGGKTAVEFVQAIRNG